MDHGLSTNRNPLFSLLRRHFVSISGLTRLLSEANTEAPWNPFNISGFVISIHDYWYFVTAGHVLKDVETAKVRQAFGGWQIDDSGAYGGTHHDAIPFDFEGAPKYYNVDLPAGYDYGVIHLRPLYVDLLLANGIEPATEDHWNNIPDEFDWIALIGVPHSTLRLEGRAENSVCVKNLVYLQVSQLSDPPADIIRPRPLFYGVIPPVDDAPIGDLEGMSGGPFVGFKNDDEGLRYWIVAAQSVWYPQRRIVVACFIRELAGALSECIHQLRTTAATYGGAVAGRAGS